MRDDKTSVKNSSTKESGPVVENGKKKSKEERPATKVCGVDFAGPLLMKNNVKGWVVVRRLPPSMTEEQFKMQVSPLPDIDYFYFVPADMSLSPNAYCRAYLNFVDQSDLFIFTQKFDGYVFLDSKGGEFPAVVEFAPFQRIPKNRPNRKKDPKVGTIEDDPVFISFKEQLEAENLENKAAANASKQHFFETSLLPEKKEVVSTPLLEYIRNKRAERQRIRDEKREEKRKKDLERRKAKEEQKKIKKDEDSSVVKVLNSQSLSKERPKEKEAKQSATRKKSEEVKHILKEKPLPESRSKDKQRTGKSYLEERQRQAERREEQRKKLSQSQSSDHLSESKSKPEILDKSVTDENIKLPEMSTVTDSEAKELEVKKEKVFKREENKKNLYKHSSGKDKEADESRKSRRTNNERIYSSSKKDYDKSEDSSRKRYSESRKSQDSIQRDRYKDKDRTKFFSQKKSSSSSADLDKSRNVCNDPVKTSGSSAPNKIMSKLDKENIVVPDEELIVNSSVSASNEIEKKSYRLEKGEEKLFETKDKINRTRRKSLDYDKIRYSTNYSLSNVDVKDKYTEKKRRNSVGSNVPIKASIDVSSLKDDKSSSQNCIQKSISKENISNVKQYQNKMQSEVDNQENVSTMKNLNADSEENNKVKRRNSTGETQDFVKEPIRRNSLGSEFKNKLSLFTERNTSRKETTKKDKIKYVKKIQQNNYDPRTERRIRNKDRPSIEIYRPGMGKFSKQRLEREKVLGSSTEVDSPSSSPSPTPILKHKNLATH